MVLEVGRMLAHCSFLSEIKTEVFQDGHIIQKRTYLRVYFFFQFLCDRSHVLRLVMLILVKSWTNILTRFLDQDLCVIFTR